MSHLTVGLLLSLLFVIGSILYRRSTIGPATIYKINTNEIQHDYFDSNGKHVKHWGYFTNLAFEYIPRIEEEISKKGECTVINYDDKFFIVNNGFFLEVDGIYENKIDSQWLLNTNYHIISHKLCLDIRNYKFIDSKNIVLSVIISCISWEWTHTYILMLFVDNNIIRRKYSILTFIGGVLTVILVTSQYIHMWRLLC